MSLTTRVLIALVVGLGLGLLISSTGNPALVRAARWIEPMGTLFINAIRMTVIPLVVGSLIAGIAAAPTPSALGKIGVRAVVFFVVTLFAAAIIAVVVAPPFLARFTIDPAAQAALQASASEAATTTAESVRRIPGFAQWLIELVPPNPVKAAADGAMLPLIVFTLAFGLAVAGLKGETRAVVVRVFESIRDAAMILVRWILWTAPVGVFALALALVVRVGASAIGALVGYIVLVVTITVLFAVLVLYPLAAIFGRVPIVEFARAALPAQAVAFSSRSSLAALPAMIESARDRLRLPDEITSFFLPLAASIYRIGAAIGQTVGVVFIAQLYGVALGPAQLATVVLTSVATSFSVPGIPGGSIVIMAPVLMAAGLPVEGIGILLGADTIPDMFRTTINVTGHMAVATAVGSGQAGKRADEFARLKENGS
jgi:proton glutamate symport protein